MAQVSGVTSPSGSDSPGQEGQLTRAEAKRQLKSEVAEIDKAIKLLVVIGQHVANLKPRQKLTITVGNQQYTVGKREFKEFARQISSALKKLPNRAFELTKAKRRVGKYSGFAIIAQFQEAIPAFFRAAEIGQVVEGGVGFNKKGKLVATGALTPTSTRLNQALWFTQQQVSGQQNPLYSVLSGGMLTPLFALHAHYANMAIPGQSGRLSASQLMRTTLRGIMEQTIREDAVKAQAAYPGMAGQIQQLQNQLLQAIDNPGLRVNSKVGEMELFNPNYFPYAHFSKLISNAKVNSGLSTDQITALQQSTVQAYSALIPGVAQGIAVHNVLDQQKITVVKATGHKNRITAAQKRAAGRAQRGQQLPPVQGVPAV